MKPVKERIVDPVDIDRLTRAFEDSLDAEHDLLIPKAVAQEDVEAAGAGGFLAQHATRAASVETRGVPSRRPSLIQSEVHRRYLLLKLSVTSHHGPATIRPDQKLIRQHTHLGS